MAVAVNSGINGGPDLSVLFDPVRIGPVTAPNRFYQVPHCSGMARGHPSSLARMREVKAEGGWGVVCTEQCDFHPTSNHLRELQLWDDRDRIRLEPLVEGIHRHGALAGIELSHNGPQVANLESRVAPWAPSSIPTRGIFPVTARAMDKDDINHLRQWHREAVQRAIDCGFDIIYVYAGHGLTLPVHFLSPVLNQRTDEYGGSLLNRMRLLRELLEDALEVAENRSAIALRFGVDALPMVSGASSAKEAAEVVAELAEVPDLWDVTLVDFSQDGASSRSVSEAHEAPWTAMVKARTSKPVVGVGWFTSPDVMADQVRRGNLDLVGAARASIADPFLPQKVRAGEIDQIRECIACNICLASDAVGVPLRCTQNPTMGEEWRRGWHPHKTPRAAKPTSVLVVGGGPAGLEAARMSAERGHSVLLAEAGSVLGGHLLSVSELPGLGPWRRVVDWRVQQLRRLKVEVALESTITVEDVIGSGIHHVAIATGATWRRDGVGHLRNTPIELSSATLTPDDVLGGLMPEGRVLIYDDDHYFMAASLALLMARKGRAVTYVSPNSLVAGYTQYTNEQRDLHAAVAKECQDVLLLTELQAVTALASSVRSIYSGKEKQVEADTVVLVTGREPRTTLWSQVHDLHHAIHRVGDALAPGTIAAAVHSGHLYGRELSTATEVASDYARDGHD